MASQEVGLDVVLDNAKRALDSQDWGAAEVILMPALDQFPHIAQIWYYVGTMYFNVDRMAMAAICLERALELEPLAVIYSNLGATYRRQGFREAAIDMLTRANEIEDSNPQTWNNLAAAWVNEGQPETGLEFANRALEIDPKFARAHWNKSLLELECGNFGAGFDEYRWGIGADRILKNYGPDIHYLPQDLSELQYYARKAEGTWQKPHLIVTGEQGIGDELMFMSLVNAATDDFQVTLDCHPRLAEIFINTWPELEIWPTRKEERLDRLPWLEDLKARNKTEPGSIYHISVSDLAAYYVRSYQDFAALWDMHGPFYRTDSDLVSEYRVFLEALAGGRKIIGLALRGGTMKTSRYYRTMKPKDMAPLLKDKRYMFVSLDYENVDAMLEAINQEHGEGTIYGFRAITHHFNYTYTSALIAATDALVTVCQSAFHMSASMGHPTYCLVPDKPAWRYGTKGKNHFWYQSKDVRLFRQKPGRSWAGPVSNLRKSLEATL